MNGIDWPSPCANLVSLESEMKEILASAGVHIPSRYASGMAPMLPLPMAALLSLTITFKVEKSLNYINAVVGQALQNCATCCPWLSMPIIGALWTQKVCSWRDCITFDCICSRFTRDRDTISQLIRSCFASFLGLPVSNQLTPHCSLNALLGGVITGNGHRLPMGPGYIYLRFCRTFQDVCFISNFIICLIIDRAQQMAAGCTSNAPANLKSGKSSLTAVVAGIQDAVSLGASLICIADGLRLVQVLSENTLPEEVEPAGGIATALKGYALAYMAIHCGAFVWGVGKASLPFTVVYPSRLGWAFVMHMEFIAMVMDGNVRLDRARPCNVEVVCLVLSGAIGPACAGMVAEDQKQDIQEVGKWLETVG